MRNLLLFLLLICSAYAYGQDFPKTYLWDSVTDRIDVALDHLPEVNNFDGYTFNYIGQSVVMNTAGQIDRYKASFYIILPYQNTVGMAMYNLGNKLQDSDTVLKVKQKKRLFSGTDYEIECNNFMVLLLERKGTIKKLQIEYQDGTVITIPTVK